MNEAFVLLNVNYKQQQNIIDAVKKIPILKAVKTIYGIYDVLVVLESNDMQEIKTAIDVDLHKIDGINNITTLVAVN
ncbi:MAG: Lrp/AsnC family transcriptional regulator [Thaumarchaeota archaeon]|nr:Lrp/AsnC family transcriptional regulator [Nitrososphaerota archaeon]MDE1840342.1 Lrp/AsnC family transcriptional regulator [Nitrososphaerota archaeon]MDE1878089.1 Lrp/AsnC family transcriptional regulator [Nitrososphaerota archaeon]